VKLNTTTMAPAGRLLKFLPFLLVFAGPEVIEAGLLLTVVATEVAIRQQQQAKGYVPLIPPSPRGNAMAKVLDSIGGGTPLDRASDTGSILLPHAASDGVRSGKDRASPSAQEAADAWMLAQQRYEAGEHMSNILSPEAIQGFKSGYATKASLSESAASEGGCGQLSLISEPSAVTGWRMRFGCGGHLSRLAHTPRPMAFLSCSGWQDADGWRSLEVVRVGSQPIDLPDDVMCKELWEKWNHFKRGKFVDQYMGNSVKSIKKAAKNPTDISVQARKGDFQADGKAAWIGGGSRKGRGRWSFEGGRASSSTSAYS
jgi:hypothetical protein